MLAYQLPSLRHGKLHNHTGLGQSNERPEANVRWSFA